MGQDSRRALGRFRFASFPKPSGSPVTLSLLLLFGFLSRCQYAACQQDSTATSKKMLPPPPLSCDAQSKVVNRGDVVEIKVNSKDETFIFAFGASAGTLVVTGNDAKLNTAGVSDHLDHITVVCSAVDRNGVIVQATANVSLPPVLVAKTLTLQTPPAITKFQGSTVIAPSVAWTTGTTTQTISGGSLLLSEVKSTSYCDPKMRQFGLAASASDTSTTKLTGPTTNVDNNEVSLNLTGAVWGKPNQEEMKENHLIPALAPRYANSYLGVGATFLDNNLLGVGLQQTYTANYQYYIRTCRESISPSLNHDGSPKPRVFASVGVGAGYMVQRLYATQSKVNSAVLPLSAQISYLHGNKAGVPPKFFAFLNLGYMPVLNDLHAYQVGITSGVQIPTRVPWLTFSLTDSELYMNNAPTGFKRNYQNGMISAVITFPAPPAKVANPLVPASAVGACYGGDKLARLYCYDDVTADACAPPSMFRAMQHCVSSGSGSLLHQFDEKIRLDDLNLEPDQKNDKKKDQTTPH